MKHTCGYMNGLPCDPKLGVLLEETNLREPVPVLLFQKITFDGETADLLIESADLLSLKKVFALKVADPILKIVDLLSQMPELQPNLFL
jgi:hypothetical protein